MLRILATTHTHMHTHNGARKNFSDSYSGGGQSFCSIQASDVLDEALTHVRKAIY